VNGVLDPTPGVYYDATEPYQQPTGRHFGFNFNNQDGTSQIEDGAVDPITLYFSGSENQWNAFKEMGHKIWYVEYLSPTILFTGNMIIDGTHYSLPLGWFTGESPVWWTMYAAGSIFTPPVAEVMIRARFHRYFPGSPQAVEYLVEISHDGSQVTDLGAVIVEHDAGGRPLAQAINKSGSWSFPPYGTLTNLHLSFGSGLPSTIWAPGLQCAWSPLDFPEWGKLPWFV